MSTNITTGTFLRNGGNRYFRIETLTAETVTFMEYNGNGPTEKQTTMSRKVFDALFKNKNYCIVKYIYSLKQGRWIEKRDLLVDGMIGANRYLIKQF